VDYHEKIFLELSALPYFFSVDRYPYSRARECIRQAVEEVGGQKIMWGSDYPGILMNCSYRETLDLVREGCDFLSTQEKKMILGETAAQVFKF